MAASTLTAEHLLDSLMYVIDPEVGINIVDLGLVYGVELEHGHATVTMTLTTPGCPLHASIEEAVHRALTSRHPELTGITVDLVWDPRWGVEFISESGREQLGWS
jgi:metal-sulfur cluster biosynthetic enzyme